jgi:1L-myo-inositol 1-phosphate cytidylyltransferase / CDP-L-myo-inositol myo-inositolphosphotransferase
MGFLALHPNAMGSEKSEALADPPKSTPRIVTFESAAEADRRVAGVSAAARIARALDELGTARTWLAVPRGRLGAATLDDLERLAPGTAVKPLEELTALVSELGPDHAIVPAVVPTASEVLRATARPSDGLVSHWLNRPISRRLSAIVLLVPAARPVHVTVFNALVGLAMVTVMFVPGGNTGLLLGGILFHAASVLDGVDGEMARATFRTSASGAALDSAVDMVINLLFLVGITANLALRDGDEIGWIGGWAILLVVVGATLIARRARAGGEPLNFELLKRSGRIRGPVDLIFWIIQTLSSRDCFAFLYMVLIIAGLERTALSIFAAIATIWFAYLLISLWSGSSPLAARPFPRP